MPLARRSLSEVSLESEREAALVVLARHAAGGSQLATELLIECIDRWGTVRGAVRRMLLDETAVADVTEDILIAVAQAVPSLPPGVEVTPWLHQLARDRAEDHLRRVRSPGAHGDEDVTTAAWLSSLIASDPAVRRLLDELPERYRDAVRWRDVERLPYAEVAIRVGRNLPTVRSHVARGRALLAGLLERSADPAPPPD